MIMKLLVYICEMIKLMNNIGIAIHTHIGTRNDITATHTYIYIYSDVIQSHRQNFSRVICQLHPMCTKMQFDDNSQQHTDISCTFYGSTHPKQATLNSNGMNSHPTKFF